MSGRGAVLAAALRPGCYARESENVHEPHGASRDARLGAATARDAFVQLFPYAKRANLARERQPYGWPSRVSAAA